MIVHRIFCSSLIAMALTYPVAAAEDAKPAADAKISYYKQILPILQAHCQGCHQPAKAGKYVMSSFDTLLKGGESGEKAIVPGEPDESYLVEQITPEDGEALDAAGQAAVGGQRNRPDPPLDRARRKGRHAGERSPAIRHGASAGVHAAAGDLVAGFLARTARSWRSPASTKCCWSKRTAPNGSRGWSAWRSELNRCGSRRTAPGWPSTGGLPCRMGEIQVWDVAKRKLLLSQPVTFDTRVRRQLVAGRQADRLRRGRQRRAGDQRRDRRAGRVHGRSRRLGARHGVLGRTASRSSRPAAT